MESQTYIADIDDTNRVYLEIEPVPVPLLKYSISGASRRTLNFRNSQGYIMPGMFHCYSGGSHISGAVLEVFINKLSRLDYGTIVNKIIDKNRGQVIFSSDGGDTKYLCSISPDTRPPVAIEGTMLISWIIKLNVLMQL